MHKKILFLVDHLKGGGAERVLLELAEHMSQKHDINIALMDSKDIKMSIPSHIKMTDLNIHNKFMSGGLWRRKNRALKTTEIKTINHLIQTEKPDLIILSHWYAMYLGPCLEGNVWIWVHGEIFNPVKKKTSNIFRWFKETRNHWYSTKYFPQFLNGKNLIVVNQDLKNTYHPYIPQANIKVIYNGVDLNKFKSPITSSEKKWDCIFVGRLSKEKQPDYALRAFAQSTLTGRMAFVGDGTMMNDLTTLAKELGILDRVDFCGWVNDVQNYIMQSHVLIMSSQQEGYGLVISEALCLKTPVVAFNCSDGVQYQLSAKEFNRGLVTPQDITALAATLSDIYHNPYPIHDEDLVKLSIENMVNEFEKLIP